MSEAFTEKYRLFYLALGAIASASVELEQLNADTVTDPALDRVRGWIDRAADEFLVPAIHALKAEHADERDGREE